MNKLVALGWFFFCTGVVFADPVDDKLSALSHLLKDAGQKKDAPNFENPVIRLAQLDPSLRRTSGMDFQDGNLESIVRQIMATTEDPKIEKAAQDLLDEIQKQRKIIIDASEAKVEIATKKAGADVLAAKVPQDLDGTLSTLEKVQSSIPNLPNIPGSPSPTAKITSAYQFVASWQDYLSQLGAGNKTAAQGTLQSLVNNRSTYGDLVPRSYILSKIIVSTPTPIAPSPLSPAFGQPNSDALMDSILKEVINLDDLPAATRKTQIALGAINYNNSDIEFLHQVSTDYFAAKGGLPQSIGLHFNNFPQQMSQGAQRILTLYYLYTIPRVLNLTGTEIPQEGETVTAYLQRLEIADEAKPDLEQLTKIWIIRERISSGSEHSFTSFPAALGQDVAGQYVFAVQSYEDALKRPSDNMPVKFIGDRLAAIKLAHPDDFNRAEQLLLAPPQVVHLSPEEVARELQLKLPPGVGSSNTLSNPAEPGK